MNLETYIKELAQNYCHLAQTQIDIKAPIQKKFMESILIIPPHPDDECLMGGLPLRFSQEFQTQVSVMPYSLGSKLDRKKERQEELKNACTTLNFSLLPAIENQNPEDFKSYIEQIKPKYIFLSHGLDLHPTHIKSHYFIMEQLEQCEYTGHLFFTEFWHALLKPNLLIELHYEDATKLAFALCEHKKEIERNPYHLRYPAWLMDNSRRGSELVGDHTSDYRHLIYSQLYEVKLMQNGRIQEQFLDQKIFTSSDSLSPLTF